MEEQVLLRTHNALWQGPGARLRGLPAPAVLLRQEPDRGGLFVIRCLDEWRTQLGLGE